MVFTDAMLAIANKELSDKLKSRWVMIIAAGFAAFTLIIAYFGSAPAGITGFRALEATIASLTSLVIYFIPILALTLGGGIDDPDDEDLNAGGRSRNDWLFGNISYNYTSAVQFMLECDHLKTSYLAGEAGKNLRFMFVTYLKF